MEILSKIIPFRKRSATTSPAPPPSGVDQYAQLIVENLPFIERQCRKAVAPPGQPSSSDNFGNPEHYSRDAASDNDADELINEVLDRLKKDDYKALRDFKGDAKLTTYITAIISNLLVDAVRSKKGRSRAHDRAREMGEIAERLYELVYIKGFSLREAHYELAETFGIREPMERLMEMLDRMRGRSAVFAAAADGDRLLVPGREVATEEGMEIIQEDPDEGPEERLSSGQRRSMGRHVVQEIIGTLSGEEKAIIVLRFPMDDDVEPKSVREIANKLNRTEKAVDNQMRRILQRLREMLLQKGLTVDDLI